MNGSNPSNGPEGRVEICYNNIYGTVCDDLFDEQAARVACGDITGNFFLLYILICFLIRLLSCIFHS